MNDITSPFRKQIAEDNQKSFNVHDKYKQLTVPELQTIQQNESFPFAVCVLNLTGDLNIGTILRSACLFGASEFILFGRRKFDIRSCVGAQNYIPVTKIAGLSDDLKINEQLFWETMEQKNYYPIFVETNGIPIHEYHFNLDAWSSRMVCLVFGNETHGIPESMTRKAITVSIPQVGVLRSFNVSSAAAIVMWEMSRQRWLPKGVS